MASRIYFSSQPVTLNKFIGRCRSWYFSGSILLLSQYHLFFVIQKTLGTHSIQSVSLGFTQHFTNTLKYRVNTHISITSTSQKRKRQLESSQGHRASKQQNKDSEYKSLHSKTKAFSTLRLHYWSACLQPLPLLLTHVLKIPKYPPPLHLPQVSPASHLDHSNPQNTTLLKFFDWHQLRKCLVDLCLQLWNKFFVCLEDTGRLS